MKEKLQNSNWYESGFSELAIMLGTPSWCLVPCKVTSSPNGVDSALALSQNYEIPVCDLFSKTALIWLWGWMWEEPVSGWCSLPGMGGRDPPRICWCCVSITAKGHSKNALLNKFTLSCYCRKKAEDRENVKKRTNRLAPCTHLSCPNLPGCCPSE